MGAIVALCTSSSPSSIISELQDAAVKDALLVSLKTTVAALAIIVFSGIPFALLIGFRKGWLGTGLEFIVTLPTILPPSVAGLALLLAFGRRGLLGQFLAPYGIHIGFTPVAVMMAQVLVATPFFVREAANAFQAMPPSVMESARLDGASSFQLLQRIILPGAAPFLITGAILAWARALSEFGATILFAGSLQGVTQTLPIAIYIGFETNLEVAKALGIILLLVAGITLILLRVLFRRSLVYAH